MLAFLRGKKNRRKRGWLSVHRHPSPDSSAPNTIYPHGCALFIGKSVSAMEVGTFSRVFLCHPADTIHKSMSKSPYQDSCFNMGTVLESNFSSSQATAPAKSSSISENDSIQVIVKYEGSPLIFLSCMGSSETSLFPRIASNRLIRDLALPSRSLPCLCIINRAFSAISIKSTSTLSPLYLFADSSFGHGRAKF